MYAGPDFATGRLLWIDSLVGGLLRVWRSEPALLLTRGEAPDLVATGASSTTTGSDFSTRYIRITEYTAPAAIRKTTISPRAAEMKDDNCKDSLHAM